MVKIPSIDDIFEAHSRLESVIVETPLIQNTILDERVGGRIYIKPEVLQRTGSFKFRGAYNRVSRIDGGQFPGGVVACSSGNHAQGVAEAAKLCGIKAAIVMPSDTPSIKIERTKRSGGEVIFYDRKTEDRDAIALELCEERQADFVHPFDDPYIIAGQGTLGLEVAERLKELDVVPDFVLAPTSGGGMLAGVGLAMQSRYPDVKLYCVEPDGFDEYRKSIEAGERMSNELRSGSICDALLAPLPGEITFAVNKDRLSGGVSVSDDDVRRAVRFAFEELKLVVEPGGAITLAALLSGGFSAQGKTGVIVLSGGNAGMEDIAAL